MSDYISREEVREQFNNVALPKECIKQCVYPRDVVARILYDCPSADVRENIHGEWIPKERTAECSVDIDIVCSECGYVGIEGYAHGYELNEINMQEVRDYTKKLDMNFCTCCGCSMDKGASE